MYYKNLGEMGRRLRKALDSFKDKYGSKLEVQTGLLDITDAFLVDKAYNAPKCFGELDGLDNVVEGYVAKGASLSDKYRLHNGHPIFNPETNQHEVDDLNYDKIVMSLLCTLGMKTISLKEVYDIGRKERFQGFTPTTINHIVQKIQTKYPNFDPDKDSFFMFGGKKNCVENQIKMSKLLLRQFLKYGSKAIHKTTYQEARLLQRIVENEKFDQSIDSLVDGDLSILSHYDYFSRSVGRIPESTAFVYHKLIAYDKRPLIKNLFIKLFGRKRFNQMKQYEIKAGKLKFTPYDFLVDAYAMNTFCGPIITSINLGIGRMSVYEAIGERLAAIVTNSVFGRLYTKWRDFIFKKVGINSESSKFKRFIWDNATFLSFQLLVYWLNVTLGGAELEEIKRTTIPAIIAIALSPKPYNIYLDRIRTSADLPLVYDVDKPKHLSTKA